MLKIAFSPCPNDTLLFYPWVQGIVGKELPIRPILADIQRLNEIAALRVADLIKVSFHSFGKVASLYQLLPIGSALGFNCGPKIISNSPLQLEDLANKRIAIPGVETTSHLLLDIFCSHLNMQKTFCLYHEVQALLERKVVDAGVIIHESRFTFAKAGFHEVADLGSLWHLRTSSPLPLGGLIVSRSLPKKITSEILSILEKCIAYSLTYPDSALDYILLHSQEKNREIVKKHIALYVTKETQCLSRKGRESIELLLRYGSQLGMFPPLPKDYIYER